ncbi:hypothetical protein [uncultured Sphaerochaeta sp.]|uniref:hypothetical protein n=1 Tax=uncultured Sphaerochaeta sp. TaxID=886478 RepID=UPI002A0A23E8|nr:hypothetical protein [uncultured Sphaerochaeta sp.]
MRTKNHLKTIMALVLLVIPTFNLFACEMSFHLTGPQYSDTRVLPGSTISLQQGEIYNLEVEFTEDHRNCTVPAEDTLFLVDGSKWKTSKTSLALVLEHEINWVEESRYINTSILTFEANKDGSTVLDILRDCRKGGYDESITFMVD